MVDGMLCMLRNSYSNTIVASSVFRDLPLRSLNHEHWIQSQVCKHHQLSKAPSYHVDSRIEMNMLLLLCSTPELCNALLISFTLSHYCFILDRLLLLVANLVLVHTPPSDRCETEMTVCASLSCLCTSNQFTNSSGSE
jgi:hypothetical protein